MVLQHKLKELKWVVETCRKAIWKGLKEHLKVHHHRYFVFFTDNSYVKMAIFDKMCYMEHTLGFLMKGGSLTWILHTLLITTKKLCIFIRLLTSAKIKFCLEIIVDVLRLRYIK